MLTLTNFGILEKPQGNFGILEKPQVTLGSQGYEGLTLISLSRA